MCPGHRNPGALWRILHLDNIYLDALRGTECLALYLLAFIEDGVHPAQVNAHVPSQIALYHAGHDILFLHIILVVQCLAFFLAYLLQNHVLCVLCGNTAEFLGIQRNLYRIPNLILGVQHLGIRQAHLQTIVLHVFHNRFFRIYRKVTGIRVHRDLYIIGFSEMVLTGSE